MFSNLFFKKFFYLSLRILSLCVFIMFGAYSCKKCTTCKNGTNGIDGNPGTPGSPPPCGSNIVVAPNFTSDAPIVVSFNPPLANFASGYLSCLAIADCNTTLQSYNVMCTDTTCVESSHPIDCTNRASAALSVAYNCTVLVNAGTESTSCVVSGVAYNSSNILIQN